jgi:WD40 repeat protein
MNPDRTVVLDKAIARERRRPRFMIALATLAFLVAGLLGAGVYRIATDNGELVIQTNRDDVEVVISQGGEVVKIIDTKTGKHVTLNSGDYELALKDGQAGLRISPDKMTLKRGKTVLATITRADKREGELNEPPPGGQVAWWRADGNAKDSVGGNHGTLKGGVTFAPGVAGQAFRLDGGTRYVEVPRSDLWGFGTRDFSIELWAQFRAVRPSEIGHPSAVFIGCDEGHGPGRGNKWFFAYGGGFLNFHINNPHGKSGFYAKARFSPDLDQWHHLAVTRSRDTFTIYVDGAPVASEEVAIIIPSPDAPLTIGQAEGLGFFAGLIDEVAIYNRALSPAEVKARWSALAPATKPKQAKAEKVGEVRRFVGHTGTVHAIAYSPDGRFALSGGGWPDGDGTLRMWDVATGKEIRQFRGHTGRVLCVAFSPDGRRVLSGGGDGDGTVRLWDTFTGTEIHRLEDSGIVQDGGVSFSPDGRQILIGRYRADHVAALLDSETLKVIRKFELPSWVVSAVFSRDGKRVLMGSDPRQSSSPLGRHHVIRLWDVETGGMVQSFGAGEKTFVVCALSPDGRYVLSGDFGEKNVRLWEVETGKAVREFQGHEGGVLSVAFSPDGRRALSGSHDHTLRLWDVETGKERHCFKGHSGDVWSVAFSPDGRYALSGSGDGTVRLWRLPGIVDPPGPGQAPEADTVDLRGLGPDVGAVYRDERKLAMTNATITVTGTGVSETGQIDLLLEAVDEEEILAVANGHITKSRLKVLSEQRTQTIRVQGQTDKHTEPAPLQGETIEFEKVGEDWKRTLVGKVPNAKQADDLKYFPPPESIADWFPAEPVSPGHSWTVDVNKLRKFFGTSAQIDSGRWKMKFDKVIQKDGKPHVQIADELEISGKFKDEKKGDVEFDWKAAGVTHLPLDPGGVVTVQLSGTMTMSAEVTESGMRLKLKITGPKTLEMKSWRK